MKETDDIVDPVEFLQQMRQVFEQRDVEFRRQEAAYQEKQDALQGLACRVSEERKLLDQKRAELEAEKKQAQLRTESLNREWEAQKKKGEELVALEKSLLFKNSLELENMRNEELRLKRLTEEYAYRLTLMDCGIAEPEKTDGKGVDLEQYMLRSEHETAVEELRAEQEQAVRALQTESKKQQEEMEKELESLRAERVRLLARNLELSGAMAGCPEEPPEKSPVSGQEIGEENADMLVQSVEPVEENAAKAEEGRGTAEPSDMTAEELTAAVLKRYIEKNISHFHSLEILHSDEGEQLYAESGGLKFRFLFHRPARFDILAGRKNSHSLQRKLKELNAQHPELKFQYENEEVCATGYFTNDMPAHMLMARVGDISRYFRQQ